MGVTPALFFSPVSRETRLMRTDIGDIQDPVARFFAFARERHGIYLKRKAGEPPPWTEDPILAHYRFTNVFRELDRTTVWFREKVRDPLRDQPEVLLATVVFRWFNRISTGEALFCAPDLNRKTAFDYLCAGYIEPMKRFIKAHCGEGPYVTGAYTINSSSSGHGLGMNKLDGVLRLIEVWLERHPDWRDAAADMLASPWHLEAFCKWVRSPCLAGFMSYEVACDLRWTALLERAPDVMTWANPGPGAKRGLCWVYGQEPRSVDRQIELIRTLLTESLNSRYWPREDGWPTWEMREVEMTLCEWDKYCRVLTGKGRPRGVFR